MTRAGVLLIHGLWLHGVTLKPLANALEQAGFEARALSYAGAARPVREHVARIAENMRAMGTDRVHVVGHSFGGLLGLRTLADHTDLPPGSAVLLGTPLKGSAASRALARWPGGSWLLGESRDALGGGFDGPLPGRDVYMIAGTWKLGLGGILAGFHEPHDGVISVAETHAPWLAGHADFAASHMSMLLSGKVHAQVVRFLQSA